jgi:hypothetical protein
MLPENAHRLFLLTASIPFVLAAQPPSGSFSQTCRRISATGNDLLAVCEKANGQFVHSELDGFDQCVGDIGNKDGALTCLKAPGSFNQTCSQVMFQNDVLSALCLSANNISTQTLLAGTSQCTGDIANINGSLSCAKVFTGAGSFKQTCKGISETNGVISASCLQGDLKTFVQTQLDLKVVTCPIDIANVNGVLTCVKQAPMPPVIPKGTTAQGCGVQQSTIQCDIGGVVFVGDRGCGITNCVAGFHPVCLKARCDVDSFFPSTCQCAPNQ